MAVLRAGRNSCSQKQTQHRCTDYRSYFHIHAPYPCQSSPLRSDILVTQGPRSLSRASLTLEMVIRRMSRVFQRPCLNRAIPRPTLPVIFPVFRPDPRRQIHVQPARQSVHVRFVEHA